jgi:hypothetical protein
MPATSARRNARAYKTIDVGGEFGLNYRHTWMAKFAGGSPNSYLRVIGEVGSNKMNDKNIMKCNCRVN